MELENEMEKSKTIKIHKPLSPEQLKETWKEQDHEVFVALSFCQAQLKLKLKLNWG